MNRQFFSRSSEEANFHLKYLNRNRWGIGSIGNTTLFHLLCSCKKDVVSLFEQTQKLCLNMSSKKMAYSLIIFVRKLTFVKLRQNRFLKSIFETTLRCTVSTVGETHETILSITGGDVQPLQDVRRSSLCH